MKSLYMYTVIYIILNMCFNVKMFNTDVYVPNVYAHIKFITNVIYMPV